MLARRVWVLLIAAAAMLVGSEATYADENRFAVVTINNNTRDVTVHFSYRWGNGDWKEFKNLQPGRAEWFAYPLNMGQAPEFHIRINEAIGAALSVNRNFRLRWNAAPDEGGRFGHQHEIVRDKQDRDYISVYDQGR